MVRARPGGDPAGPAHHQRHPDPPLVDRALQAAQGTRALEELPVRPAGVGGAVVAAEGDQRVVVDPELLEQDHQSPDVPVHARDHGRVHLLALLPRLIRVGIGRRNLVLRVRHGVGQVQEEGLVPAAVLTDELQRRLREQIVCVLLLLPAGIARLRVLLLVQPDEIGIVGVGPSLIEIAKPLVEALPVGLPSGIRLSQPPTCRSSP